MGERIAAAVDFGGTKLMAGFVDVIRGTGGGSAASVPIHVIQGYNVPGFVDKNTIVIACSHSGKTDPGGVHRSDGDPGPGVRPRHPG